MVMPPGAAWLGRGQEPFAVRLVDDFFCTSGIAGIDPATGLAPSEPGAQFALAFQTLVALLAEQGIAPAAIGLLTVYIPSRAHRPYIDPPWLELFPNPERRPARKTNEVPLPEGLFVQLQATGLRGAEARSVEIAGLRHRAPLPMGALVGTTLFSSVIGGDDPATGTLLPDPAAQIEQAFVNASLLIEQAGGHADGINHLWAFMDDMALSPLMLGSYLRAFADADSRPARKTVPYALPEGLAIQLQITGDVGGRIGNFEVPGVGHHDPIPMASKAGRLLQSSGIHGIDPATSAMTPGGLREETRHSLDSVEAVVAAAAGSLASIAGLTMLVRDVSFVPWLNEAIVERFPASAVPATRFIRYELPSDLAVQFHLTGWI